MLFFVCSLISTKHNFRNPTSYGETQQWTSMRASSDPRISMVLYNPNLGKNCKIQNSTFEIRQSILHLPNNSAKISEVFADFVASLFKKRTATHINQTSINYSSRCSEAGCDFLVSIWSKVINSFRYTFRMTRFFTRPETLKRSAPWHQRCASTKGFTPTKKNMGIQSRYFSWEPKGIPPMPPSSRNKALLRESKGGLGLGGYSTLRFPKILHDSLRIHSKMLRVRWK